MVLAVTACRPALARADDDVDFDLVVAADTKVADAQAAAAAGDWETARELAEEALALDDSLATAPARLILVEALRLDGALDSALYELNSYLALPLTPEARADAERLDDELSREVARQERRSARRVPSKGAGIGLLVGGAIPVAGGAYLLGNDIAHLSQGTESGTWAIIGSPTLAVGLVLEVAGAVVLSRSRTQPAPGATVQAPTILPTVGSDGRAVTLGVVGQW